MKSAMLLLILCCFYITSLHAFSRGGCICLKVTPFPVPARLVKKVEVIPPTGRCRKTEIIITRRRGGPLCADPKAKWLQDLLSTFRQGMEGSSSTARPTITSTTTNHQG
ncbi:Interleukin-8 [Oryzias melastigma]|nr:interleukin-8 [Oryzias melastigma]KAF6733666.1 Interleukin-8 [Oryzias melastigma]